MSDQVNEPRQPIVWDDNTIIAAYQRAFGKNPDVHHMALLTWMRDEMQARIAELESQLAAVEMWQPVEDDYWGYLNVERKGTVITIHADSVQESDNGYLVVPLPDDVKVFCRTPVEKGGDDA